MGGGGGGGDLVDWQIFCISPYVVVYIAVYIYPARIFIEREIRHSQISFYPRKEEVGGFL